MSDTTKPKVPGDKLSAQEVNQDLPIEFTSGTPISSTPMAVYIGSNGKVYHTTATGTPTSDDNFIGFAVDVAATADVVISVQMKGIVSGFSGLTVGAFYYLSNTSGAVSITPGTYEKKVGIAISATELLIIQQPKTRVANGSFSRADNAGTGTVEILVGFPSKMICIKAVKRLASSNKAYSDGVGISTSSFQCLYNSDDSTNYAQHGIASRIIYLVLVDGTVKTSATLSAIGTVSFTLDFDVHVDIGSSYTASFLWFATG